MSNISAVFSGIHSLEPLIDALAQLNITGFFDLPRLTNLTLLSELFINLNQPLMANITKSIATLNITQPNDLIKLANFSFWAETLEKENLDPMIIVYLK